MRWQWTNSIMWYLYLQECSYCDCGRWQMGDQMFSFGTQVMISFTQTNLFFKKVLVDFGHGFFWGFIKVCSLRQAGSISLILLVLHTGTSNAGSWKRQSIWVWKASGTFAVRKNWYLCSDKLIAKALGVFWPLLYGQITRERLDYNPGGSGFPFSHFQWLIATLPSFPNKNCPYMFCVSIFCQLAIVSIIFAEYLNSCNRYHKNWESHN